MDGGWGGGIAPPAPHHPLVSTPLIIPQEKLQDYLIINGNGCHFKVKRVWS